MTERLVLIAATLVLAAIGLLPVAAMLKETLIADGRFSLDAYRALLASGDHLVLLMSHSLQLAFLTASLATLIGVPLGVLLGETDLPWRSALTLVFAAPLLLPSYVLAIAWFSIVGRTGRRLQSSPFSARQATKSLTGSLRSRGVWQCDALPESSWRGREIKVCPIGAVTRAIAN